MAFVNAGSILAGDPAANYDYDSCTERLREVFAGRGEASLVKVHLENFKAVNDSFGYRFGSLLLEEISKYLDGIMHCDVYRVSGVSFVLFIPSGRAALQGVVGNIVERFEDSWLVGNIECICSVNIGVAHLPGLATGPEMLLGQLEQALSESAEAGFNRPIVYGELLAKKILRKNIIAQSLPGALRDGLVEVRYRPTYHVPSDKYLRIDCYMRLMSEELGAIHADEFIPIAEESGQIYAISEYMITAACALVAKLLEAGKEFEVVAIPISPMQLLQTHFVRNVVKLVMHSGIPAGRLAFEVTESVALSTFPRAQSALGDLSDLGVEIVLRDFGSGYSGLSNILSMSVDAVKLTRDLIWLLDNSANAMHVVEGLISVAKKLDLKLIAEGVETKSQVELLEGFGCEYEQGFYYSPTLTLEELLDMLSDA